MRKTTTHTPLSCVLGLSLLATIALACAPTAADEIYVVDRNAGPGSNGALFRVDPASGNRNLVSDFGNASQGPVGIDPFGLALAAGTALGAASTVLVIDSDLRTNIAGALFRVDPASGARSLVSDFGDAIQGSLGTDPSGLALAAGGTVLVIDPNAGTNGALFRVDPAGVRSLVSDFGNAAQGPVGSDPRGLALEVGGTVLVIDASAGTGFVGALFRVEAAGGNRSLVSDFGNPAQGPPGLRPSGLALEAAGTVLVIDQGGGIGDNGALFRVDGISGNRSLISDFGNAAQGPPGRPSGLALEAAGTVLVIDPNAGPSGSGALFRVDRLSGQRTVLSDFDNFGQGGLGVDPSGVAVVVPNCQGRFATIVGDDGNNLLIGSPGDDVILGRGGNDQIDGGRGNDRICGGAGNDRLRGGTGNDRMDGDRGNDGMNGEAGNDRLRGGSGMDRMRGDTGNDELDGQGGADFIQGGAGNDEMDGDVGPDIIQGGAGNDEVDGDVGPDIMEGDTGNDHLCGGAGNDVMRGGSGRDLMGGETGNDTMRGDAGNDRMNGGPGSDNLDGGTGTDVCNEDEEDDNCDKAQIGGRKPC